MGEAERRPRVRLRRCHTAGDTPDVGASWRTGWRSRPARVRRALSQVTYGRDSADPGNLGAHSGCSRPTNLLLLEKRPRLCDAGIRQTIWRVLLVSDRCDQGSPLKSLEHLGESVAKGVL